MKNRYGVDGEGRGRGDSRTGEQCRIGDWRSGGRVNRAPTVKSVEEKIQLIGPVQVSPCYLATRLLVASDAPHSTHPSHCSVGVSAPAS